MTILMDLQGTLGGDPMGDITSFEFYPGVLKALKRLSDCGHRLIVITNQSRISMGFISQETYNTKTQEINTIVCDNGIRPLEFYCCPHTKEDACDCKKPLLGLFDQANARAVIDKERCVMIGDMGMSDMLFAHMLGIQKILVLTGVGEGSLKDYRSTWLETEPDYIAVDFCEATTWILKSKF